METNLIVPANNKDGRALIAGVKSGKIAILLSDIVTIENIPVSDVNVVNFNDVIYLRGAIIPLVYMNKLFNLDDSDVTKDKITVVICSYEDTYIGLVVDELFDQETINPKSLGILSDSRFFNGAAILDDTIALVINVESLVA